MEDKETRIMRHKLKRMQNEFDMFVAKQQKRRVK